MVLHAGESKASAVERQRKTCVRGTRASLAMGACTVRLRGFKLPCVPRAASVLQPQEREALASEARRDTRRREGCAVGRRFAVVRNNVASGRLGLLCNARQHQSACLSTEAASPDSATVNSHPAVYHDDPIRPFLDYCLFPRVTISTHLTLEVAAFSTIPSSPISI